MMIHSPPNTMRMTLNPLLEARHLVKTYKSITAVDDVTFAIPEGICFGLLGPNGAGKTTTIEMMEGILSATSGEVYYKGAPRTRAFNEEIGIQFQHTALLAFLTVRETLKTFQKLYHKTADIDSLLATCNLLDIQNQYNDKISGGQRQRLLLALALVNRPVLLFLDEPSTGLDPQARRNLWDIVLNIKSRGKTIILTTHYMEEAQLLCDEVAIMDYGRIIARGTVAELIGQYCGEDSTGQPCPEANLETVFIKLTGRQLRE
jgi:ABC-2 type transport system ATP-binding protein